MDSYLILKSLSEALSCTGWRHAMNEEMTDLEQYRTLDLMPLPNRKKAVGFRWVYTVKLNLDGSISG